MYQCLTVENLIRYRKEGIVKRVTSDLRLAKSMSLSYRLLCWAGVFSICAIAGGRAYAQQAAAAGADFPRAQQQNRQLPTDLSVHGLTLGDDRLDALAPTTVMLYHNFYHDDVRGGGQCSGATGARAVRLGDWLPFVRMDMDNQWGGCIQQFAITDPMQQLTGLVVNIDFRSMQGADGNQCGNAGSRPVPITATSVDWSYPMRLDTDDRVGGCSQTWSLSGRSDIAIELQFFPDDSGVGQCAPPGPHNGTTILRVLPNQPVTLGINTDGRYGGCQFRARLVRTK